MVFLQDNTFLDQLNIVYIEISIAQLNIYIYVQLFHPRLLELFGGQYHQISVKDTEYPVNRHIFKPERRIASTISVFSTSEKRFIGYVAFPTAYPIASSMTLTAGMSL